MSYWETMLDNIISFGIRLFSEFSVFGESMFFVPINEVWNLNISEDSILYPFVNQPLMMIVLITGLFVIVIHIVLKFFLKLI